MEARVDFNLIDADETKSLFCMAKQMYQACQKMYEKTGKVVWWHRADFWKGRANVLANVLKIQGQGK